MGLAISLRDGKILMACWREKKCLFAERILGTEGEGALGKHWEPGAAVVCLQTHGVKHSVGPTLDNVGTQLSAFYTEHYQVKEVALKRQTVALILVFRGRTGGESSRFTVTCEALGTG